MWARTPLRVKLVATLLLLVTAALTVAGVAATAALRSYLLGRVDSQLRQALHPYVDQRGPGGPGPRPGDGDGRGGPPSQYYVQFLAADGTPGRVQRNPLYAAEQPPDLPHLKVDDVGGRPFTVAARAGGDQWRVVGGRLPNGAGSVLIAQNLSDIQQTVDRLRLLELVIGVTVVVLLGGLGYVVVRSSLRPLVEVEHTAAAIAAGDLSQRVPHRDERTEVGRLAAALNSMLHQVESAFRTREASEQAARRSEERMRRFVADASHELRTPLTSIRGFAELYRQGAARDPAEIGRLMRRIEDEGARMGLLVDDLLLLARMDQQRPVDLVPVDLLVLAADAVHDAQAVDPARRISLDAAGLDLPAVVLGDEPRLRQILGNLMANALHHTPAGTPVTVRLSHRPRLAVVEVADEGPGLDEEDAKRVFERFYRADPSRHRGSGGSGLGLSIVAALTAAHGGSVELDTAPGRGATFRVLLPLMG
jgi:two-component system OmpR family sensor kinase